MHRPAQRIDQSAYQDYGKTFWVDFWDACTYQTLRHDSPCLWHALFNTDSSHARPTENQIHCVLREHLLANWVIWRTRARACRDIRHWNHRKAMQAGTRQIEKRAPDLPTSDQGPRPQRRALDGSRLHGYDALGVGVEGAGSGRDDTADAEVQGALTC